MSAVPELSILVCTRNRSRALTRCLAAIRRQRERSEFETIVVDNGSTDDTPAVVERLARDWRDLRLVQETKVGIAAARNRAVAEARTPLVAYLDDDVEPFGDWIGAITRGFAETDAAALGGPMLARFEEPVAHELAAHVGMVLSCQDYGEVRREIATEPYLFSANFGVRRAEFERVGGFNEALGRTGMSLLAYEDVDFCERLVAAGRKLVYEPSAVVFHWIEPARLTDRFLRRRSVDLGRSMAVRLAMRMPRPALLATLAAKSAKLPLHLLFWAGARLVGMKEAAFVAERNALVTVGVLAYFSRARPAPKAPERKLPER